MGQPTTLVAVGTGIAPFATRYEETGGRPLGVEFVARVGSRALAGKIGVDCDAGWIYVGAMHVERRLHPEKLCGREVHLDAPRPILCRLD